MSLLGKRPTKLLALMLIAVLACAAMLLAGAAAPANAAPKEPLFITAVQPAPEALDVPAMDVPVDDDVVVYFNQPLRLTDIRPNMHLTIVETGDDVRRPLCYSPDPDAPAGSDATILAFLLSTDNICGDTGVDTTPLECGTTYEVSVSGQGRAAVKGFDRSKLSGVLDDNVTFEKGIASWTFTTVDC
jgi:hypothetical protein